MISRRTFFIGGGALMLAAPLTCFAQAQPSRNARLGLIESSSSSAKWKEALMTGLRELGYVEGKNLLIEYRWAEGKPERLLVLAAELAQFRPHVIVAGGDQAIRAAGQAMRGTPIVMVRTGDPVAAGFVSSLARPGGNVTGMSNFNVDLSSKFVELLRAAVPRLSRVTVLMNPGNKNLPERFKRIEAAAKTYGIAAASAEAMTVAEIDAALAAIKQNPADALIVPADGFFLAQAQRIAAQARQHRVPTMFTSADAVESGGLMSYGQNVAEQFYRAATYVDKILKGTKPGELPVEQPMKIELVVNLKTAKVIGLAIPSELLLRADKVIE